MTSLDLKSISIAYNGATVLKDVDLYVANGDILALLGPSGCGKTSLLRVMAGLMNPARGSILLGERDVTDLPPQKRDVGVVFQEHLLFPHMTVIENVAFGLRARRVAPTDALERARDMLTLVGLGDRASAFPSDLSGGQSQRVALARALAPHPRLLLLDEPFSSLDVDLRIQLRSEVRRIVKSLGITAVIVTHDREEAMVVADNVALVGFGSIVENGTVRDMFERPRRRYTAEFFGRANVFPVKGSGGQTARLGSTPIVVDQAVPAGRAVLVAVQSGQFRIAAHGIPVDVLEHEWLGERVNLICRAVENPAVDLRVSLDSSVIDTIVDGARLYLELMRPAIVLKDSVQ